MKKSIYNISLCLLVSFLSISCKKWVDVKPTDRLGEDLLYADKAGFVKAINGVYVEMANNALYGQTMTTGAIDVLAQYYYTGTNTTHRYFNLTTFNYGQESVKTTFDDAWRKAYELNANCNVIVEKCGDAASDILPEPYYGVIKGEALALRAMLHFDMLRLFGPTYTEENKYKPAIPYVDSPGYDVFPLSSSEEVMDKVIDDLRKALSLLETTDPIRTQGVLNGSNPIGPNDLYYRQYRLNYYAVKALLARAYLWKADKQAAFIQAEELLNEVQSSEKNVFPFVTFARVTNVTTPDRMFSTEVMFSIYDINRKKMFERLFDVNIQGSRLTFNNNDSNMDRVNSIYDDANDYRRRVWQNISTGSTTALTNMKYADVVDGPGRYMIPLIRISEVILIAAECHPDLSEGIKYFNQLRTARNTVSLNPATEALFKTEIGKEYRREMLGEGQQFFFYKRNGYVAIPNHATVKITPEKSVSAANYMVPLPDSETSFRN